MPRMCLTPPSLCLFSWLIVINRPLAQSSLPPWESKAPVDALIWTTLWSVGFCLASIWLRWVNYDVTLVGARCTYGDHSHMANGTVTIQVAINLRHG